MCEAAGVTMHLARFAFYGALIGVIFFALVPGPLGAIIESGGERHVLAFAALPVLSAIGWPNASIRVQFFAYALFGASIELAQGWMAVGRNAQLNDWLVDMFAAGTALLVVRAVRYRLATRST